MTEIASFIAGLPKAELHVHHIGSASPQTVAQLAARHDGATPVPADPQRLAEYFTFTDFAHFIDVYLSVVDLIRDAEDVWTLTYDVARDMAAQNVRYAELTLTPYSSVIRGIPAEAFCEAVEDARRRAEDDFGIALRWCFDIPGEAGVEAADMTLDMAVLLRPDGLVSFGLGGPELGVPAQHLRRTLQGRSRGRAAQRSARGGVCGSGIDLGGDRAARGGADRAWHRRCPGRRAAHPVARGRHRVGDLPDFEPVHPLGARPWRTIHCRRSSKPA